jgi:hypothetical protein
VSCVGGTISSKRSLVSSLIVREQNHQYCRSCEQEYLFSALNIRQKAFRHLLDKHNMQRPILQENADRADQIACGDVWA